MAKTTTLVGPKTEMQMFTAMRDFSVASMQWCMQQSEVETSQIYDVLTTVMADATRRAQMSEEVLKAIKNLGDKTAALKSTGKGKLGMKSLVQALEQVNKEHEDLRRLTDPIIEALQFQDRLRQNLDNVGKLLTVWVAARQKVAAAATVSPATPLDMDAELLDLGGKLLGCMTSEDERAVVREFIPGLPEDKAAVDDIALF